MPSASEAVEVIFKAFIYSIGFKNLESVFKWFLCECAYFVAATEACSTANRGVGNVMSITDFSHL